MKQFLIGKFEAVKEWISGLLYESAKQRYAEEFSVEEFVQRASAAINTESVRQISQGRNGSKLSLRRLSRQLEFGGSRNNQQKAFSLLRHYGLIQARHPRNRALVLA